MKLFLGPGPFRDLGGQILIGHLQIGCALPYFSSSPSLARSSASSSLRCRRASQLIKAPVKKNTRSLGTSLSENRCAKSGSVKPIFQSKDRQNVARMPGPNPPNQPLSTIAQTKNGVWKVGACTEVLNVKVTAHATKTRKTAIANGSQR